MIEIVFLCIGVFIGIAIKDEVQRSKYNKTYAQVDLEIKKDLELYRNLSESLKQDMVYYKRKIADLEAQRS